MVKRFINGAFKIIFSRMLIIFLMVVVQIMVLLVSFLWLGSYLHYIWEGMSLLGAVLIIYIVNRDEPAEFKVSWIIPICIFPVLGALIYVFVMSNAGGIGLKTKMYVRTKETEGLLRTSTETAAALKECPEQYRGFSHYMEHRGGYPAYHNSEAVYYPLGEDKFADLLQELKKAQRFIFLEYFIVERGIMWNAVLDILKEKVKEGVEVITPNPKTSGGACWNFLAAWAYQKERGSDENACKDFMKRLYQNVLVLDSGARGATNTFVENGQGDVLIAWENEAYLSMAEYPDQYEIITPSISILAQPSVAVVDVNAKAHGTEEAAKAYLEYLYSDEAQRLAGQNYYRPSREEILQEFSGQFDLAMNLVTIDDFGGWKEAYKTFFDDGAVFDQIYAD